MNSMCLPGNNFERWPLYLRTVITLYDTTVTFDPFVWQHLKGQQHSISSVLPFVPGYFTIQLLLVRSDSGQTLSWPYLTLVSNFDHTYIYRDRKKNNERDTSSQQDYKWNNATLNFVIQLRGYGSNMPITDACTHGRSMHQHQTKQVTAISSLKSLIKRTWSCLIRRLMFDNKIKLHTVLNRKFATRHLALVLRSSLI